MGEELRTFLSTGASQAVELLLELRVGHDDHDTIRGRVPEEGDREAVAFTSPIDGRVMFVLPWGDLSYIGTTDTDTLEPPDDLRVIAGQQGRPR